MKSASRMAWPLAGLVLIAVYLFWTRTPEPPANTTGLPTYGTIRDFSLTNQHGQEVGVQHLSGQVWIASFVFTRCQGPCPMMTEKMAELQQQLTAIKPLKLVSITMDPEYDSQEVLRAYGDRYGANHNTWWFLTGDKASIIKLAIEAFKLPAGEDPDMHSTRFVLIDGSQQIRGYYSSLEANAFNQLVEDAKKLNQERA